MSYSAKVCPVFEVDDEIEKIRSNSNVSCELHISESKNIAKFYRIKGVGGLIILNDKTYTNKLYIVGKGF